MKKFFSMLSIVLLTFTISADLTKIKERGNIFIGMKLGYVPFEFRDKDGNISGFDYEIAKYIASKLEVGLSIVDLNFDTLFQKLEKDEIDIALSAITKTSEREKRVDFTDLYFITGQRLLINKRIYKKMDWQEFLKKPEASIAIIKGTMGEKLANDNYPDAQKKIFTEEKLAAQAVISGNVSAFIYDEPFLKAFADKNKRKVALSENRLTIDEYAIAIKKGNTELMEELNKIIKELKNSSEYKKIYKKWFEK